MAASASGLSTFDMLGWIDDAAAADFRRMARTRTFKSGETIYTQSDPGSAMYRVTSGSVRLTTRIADGREATFLLFRSGDCFGVSSLVDGDPRPQTAECLSRVELEVVEQRDFDTLLDRHSSFAKGVMILLARQMRTVSRYYVRSSLASLTSRVALRVAEVGMAEHAAGGSFALPLSQADLATFVGASRQSVNRVLQSLRNTGLIRISKGQIDVADLDGLLRHAETI